MIEVDRIRSTYQLICRQLYGLLFRFQRSSDCWIFPRPFNRGRINGDWPYLFQNPLSLISLLNSYNLQFILTSSLTTPCYLCKGESAYWKLLSILISLFLPILILNNQPILIPYQQNQSPCWHQLGLAKGNCPYRIFQHTFLRLIHLLKFNNSWKFISTYLIFFLFR